MHEVVSHMEGESLFPAVALVCYRVGDDPRRVGFVSRHPIEVSGAGVPHIKAGRPLGAQELRDIVASLSQRDIAWIDPRVLAQSSNAVVWWSPPRVSTVWWKPVLEAGSDYDSLPTRRQALRLPGLVFRLDRGKGLSVFALRARERPRPETPLFHAPFANVYDLGGVCLGDVRVPDDDWRSWEEAFLSSVFTHDVGSIRRVHGFDRSFKALDRLAATKAKRFPNRWLRAANKDLAWLIAEGGGISP
jgi:PRTRC genetic system protein B